MSIKTPFIVGRDQMSVAAGATNYFPILQSAGSPGFANETNVRDRIHHGGTLSNLAILVKTNNATSGNIVVTVRINNTNAALTISIPAGAGNVGLYEDNNAAHNVTVTDGDYLSIKIVGATGGSIVFEYVGCWFTETGGNAVVRLGHFDGSQNAAATRYARGAGGTGAHDTTEANAQVKIPFAATLKDFRSFVYSNGMSSGVATRGNRVNGADGVASFTQYDTTNGNTGEREDTTNDESLSADDLINWWSTNSKTGAVAGHLSAALEHATRTLLVASAGSAIAVAQNAGATNYHFPIGKLAAVTSEADALFRIKSAFTLKNLRIYVSANSLSGDAVFTVRKTTGGVTSDTSLKVTVASSGTGWQVDDSNSVAFADGDDLSISVVTAAGTGTISYHVVLTAPDYATTTNYSLSVDSVAYAVTPTDVGFSVSGGATLPANSVAYNISPTNAQLRISRTIVANSLAFSVTPSPLSFNMTVYADAPAYLITPTAATLTRNATPDKTIVANSVAYTVTATAATLTFGGRRLRAQSVHYFIAPGAILTKMGGITNTDGITSSTLN